MVLTQIHHEKRGAGRSTSWNQGFREKYQSPQTADDTALMAESEEELKSLLMKVKEESGKSWLKAQHSENRDHGIWSHHFMGNRWGNSGNNG